MLRVMFISMRFLVFYSVTVVDVSSRGFVVVSYTSFIFKFILVGGVAFLFIG